MWGGRVRGASSKGKIVWAEKSTPLGPLYLYDRLYTRKINQESPFDHSSYTERSWSLWGSECAMEYELI